MHIKKKKCNNHFLIFSIQKKSEKTKIIIFYVKILMLFFNAYTKNYSEAFL